MAFFGDAVLYALVITIIVGALSMIRKPSQLSKSLRSLAGASILPLIFNVFFIWAILYWARPAMTGSLWGYGWLVFPLLLAGITFLGIDAVASDTVDDADFGLGGVIATVLAIVLICFWIFDQWTVRNQGGATHLASQVTVIYEPADAYPPTDADHIVQVPEETAVFKASQVIAKETIGEGRNLSTVYRTGTPELQSVNNHLYWVFDLEFAGWRTWNQVEKVSPGFIAVDAEDPDAEARMELGFTMKYTPSAWFGNKLQRRIYDAGYNAYILDGLSMEVDDDWRPYYTVAINKRTLHNKGEVPGSMLLIDPETGDITEYNLDEIPDWIDRVYSKDTVKRMINWWGNYGDPEGAPYRFFFRPQTGRFKAADDPVLVYTTSGHPAWQVTLVSLNKDTSIIYVALFDARRNEVRLYDLIRGTATENAVQRTFQSIPENIRGDYKATHLSMHKIYGVPTWVANYVLTSDNSSQGEPYQGIGFINAHDLQGTSVAYAKTKEGALDLYRNLLARRPDNSAPGEDSIRGQTAEGSILHIATEIENGNTVYLLVLESDPTKVYKASKDASPEIAFTQVGDPVVITFVDVGQEQVDVSQFNNLGVPIVP